MTALSRPDTIPGEVIVIYLTDREAAFDAVSELISQKVACVDVLEYSSGMHFAEYLTELDPEERVPLLFLFSRNEKMLVQTTTDLSRAELWLKSRLR